MLSIFQNDAVSVSGSPSITSPGRGIVTLDTVLDAMNAHSQAGEPPLSFVMEFNAAESRWRETQDRLQIMLEDIETRACTDSFSKAAKKELGHANQSPSARTD